MNLSRIAQFAVPKLSYRDKAGIGFGKCPILTQTLIESQANHHRQYCEKSPTKLQSPVKIRSETELIKPSKTYLVKRRMGSAHVKSSWVILLHHGASETVTSEPGRTGWAI